MRRRLETMKKIFTAKEQRHEIMKRASFLSAPACLQLSFVVFFWSFSLVIAQSKTGTTVGQFLLIEPSAHSAAMGNAGVSGTNEAIATFYNPAALAQMQNSDVQFTHSTWLAGITYDYAAAAVKVGEDNSLFLGVTSLNSGDIAVRTVNQPLGTGESYSVSDIALGVGYGQKVTDRFSAGLQVKYIQETIWHSSLVAFAVDLGTLYEIVPNVLRLGASLSNFGTNGQYQGSDLQIRYAQNSNNGDNNTLPGNALTDSYPLPIVFRVGLGYTLAVGDENKFNLVVDAFHPSDNTESLSFGGEWKFMNIFSVRAGYENARHGDISLSGNQEDADSGFTQMQGGLDTRRGLQ
jgi:Type IX secretion system protein PorV